MDGNAATFIVLIAVTPVLLALLILLPNLADRSSARERPRAGLPDQDPRSPRPVEPPPSGRAHPDA